MMYAEIRNDHIWGPAVECGTAFTELGDMLAAVSIDGWLTDQDDEEGVVIANVILTKHGDVAVDFHDSGARSDEQVLLCIGEAKARLKDLWHEEKSYRSLHPKNRKQCVEYRTILKISDVELEQINKFLSAKTKDQYQGEDNIITYTVKFPDRKEMDIKCCGCRDEASWAEAVLFDDHGSEIACSDVEESFTGPWELEVDGTIYIAEVRSSVNRSTENRT